MAAPSVEIDAGYVMNIADGGGDSVPGLSKELSGWDVYNNEAKKVDTELVKDWMSSLNSLLIFAAIFAAVLTAFIVESKKLLEQDPTSVMADVMIFYTNNVANGTHTAYVPPEFQPTVVAISVNCLFFASLSVSLVAALASVIALQWVADYDAAITRGGSSPEDRAKRRQFRYAGVISWKMGEVIAALPLLLYCSVILFFIGLVQWMWNVHPFVGAIVSVGAGIAALFYGSSTMLSVMFVSAPFRTPLSRWIYKLSLLVLDRIHRLLEIVHSPYIPSGFQRQNDKSKDSQDREDRAVTNRKQLGRDSMVWLAKQLSLSQDSYKRFLLLMGELYHLRSEQASPLDATGVEWGFIFDMVACRYMSNQGHAGVTAEDRHAMATFQRCWEIASVRALVAPNEESNYVMDKQHENYWSQYCNFWESEHDVPNGLFLLMRDLPTQLSLSTEELDAAIQLCRWRNSYRKLARIWSEILESVGSFGPLFLNPCIETFASFSRHRGRFAAQRSEQDILIKVMRTKLLRVEPWKIYRDSLHLLIQAYESLLDTALAKNQDLTIAGISSPLAYGSQLRHRPASEHQLHDHFIHLLAYQLNISDWTSMASVAQQVKDILVMLWLRPSNPALMALRDLGYKHGMYKRTKELARMVPMHWISSMEKLPDVSLFESLSRAQRACPRGVGPLWRAVLPNQINDPQFVEALGSFDSLIAQGCTPNQHLTLVRLVCQDIQLDPSPDFKDYFTPERAYVLTQIKDPCLMFLAQWVQGVEDVMMPFERKENPLAPSWTRIEIFVFDQHEASTPESVASRQASLWPAFSGQEDFCERALSEPDILSHIQRIFRHPVHCPSCHDGPGHLLFHLLNVSTYYVAVLDLVLFKGTLEMNIHLTDVTLVMLSHWLTPNPITLMSMFEDAHEEHVEQVTAMLRDIETSQVQYLTFLWNLCRRYRASWADSEEIAVVLACIERALELSDEDASVVILEPLASCLTDLRDRMLLHGTRRLEQARRVSVEVGRLCLELRSRVARRIVYGRMSRRLVSCVRGEGEGGYGYQGCIPFLD